MKEVSPIQSDDSSGESGIAAGSTAAFSASSPDMLDGTVARAQFANIMGGDGDNLSPQIDWHDAPASASSFVVTMFDRDAPTGFGWWHWVVVNIPATVRTLERGTGTNPERLPLGAIEVNTDAGVPGYGGPLPPKGETHRYEITVTALNIPKIDLPATATPALLAYMMLGHIVGTATFTVRGSQ